MKIELKLYLQSLINDIIEFKKPIKYDSFDIKLTKQNLSKWIYLKNIIPDLNILKQDKVNVLNLLKVIINKVFNKNIKIKIMNNIIIGVNLNEKYKQSHR